MNKITLSETNFNGDQKLNSLMSKAQKAEKLGNFDKAKSIYELILEKYPSNVKAKNKLKKIEKVAPIPNLVPLIESGRFADAEQILLSNIERDANNPHFWKLLGVIYHHMQDFSMSFQCYEKAIALNPNDHELIFQFGCDLLELDDVGNAYKAFKLLLSLDPKAAAAHTNIGVIYSKIKKFEQAKLEWRQALNLDPKDTLALSHLGIALIETEGNFNEAIDLFNQSMEINPEDVNNLVNLATAHFELGQVDTALDIYSHWEQKNWNNVDLKLQNDYNLNYSLSLFSAGKVAKAWELYSGRVDHRDNFVWDTEQIPFPRLKSLDDAKNKTVLLLLEQGIGDQIFFLGLLKSFIEKSGSNVILFVEPRIKSLIERSFPDVPVITDENIFEINADYWIPYGDMGSLMDFSQNTPGLCAPYLVPPKRRNNKLGLNVDDDKIKVGFAWRSGLLNARRMQSFTYLQDWKPIINNTNIAPICLQYGDITDDLAELDDATKNNLIVPEIDLKNDFEGLASIIDECDLVFGPSSAPILQAAAQGKKSVMYMLKGGGDRWAFGKSLLTDEYSSPWYNNCTNIAFQQSKKEILINRICDIIDATAQT